MAEPKRRVGRTAARKVRDKWKAKTWYPIRAPTMFNEAVVGETMADDPDKLKGRMAETTLQELNGDFSKMHVKLFFRVKGVRGSDAVTTFAGHDLTSDYVRRLVRRRQSKIDDVIDVTTSEGFKVRLKPMVITERRAQASQRLAIRAIIRETVEAEAAKGFAQLVKGVLSGELSRSIAEKARMIVPVKRTEFRRSQVIAEPEEEVVLPEIFPAPEPEPEPEPEVDEAAEATDDATDESTDEESADESGEEE